MLGLGLLRRVLGGGAGEREAGRRDDAGVPWYMQSEADEVTPDRIEAAQRRLKETIPAPEAEEAEGEEAGGAP